MEITVEEMLKTIHGHPTFSEVMYEAFADVLGLAFTHLRRNNIILSTKFSLSSTDGSDLS